VCSRCFLSAVLADGGIIGEGEMGGAKEQIFQPQITHKFFVFWSSKKAMDTTLTKFSGTVVEVKG